MAQIKNATTFLFRWNGRTAVRQGAQVSYFHYQTDAQGVEIPGSAFESAPEPVSIDGSAGVPLADIVGLINADALSAVNDLAAEKAITATQAQTIAAQAAQIKVLEEQINPHPAIGIEFVQIALAKSDPPLSDVWAKSVEITIQTLSDAEDPDPKRVYRWWYGGTKQINFQEPEWAAIVAEMDKMGAWKDHGAALIALAQQFAAG